MIANLKSQRDTLAKLLILTTNNEELERLKDEIFPKAFLILRGKIDNMEECETKASLRVQLRLLEELRSEFDGEFFMDDILLTYLRAKQIIASLNNLSKLLAKEIGLSKLLNENLDDLLDYYQHELYLIDLFLEARGGKYPNFVAESKRLSGELNSFKDRINNSSSEEI